MCFSRPITFWINTKSCLCLKKELMPHMLRSDVNMTIGTKKVNNFLSAVFFLIIDWSFDFWFVQIKTWHDLRTNTPVSSWLKKIFCVIAFNFSAYVCQIRAKLNIGWMLQKRFSCAKNISKYADSGNSKNCVS